MSAASAAVLISALSSFGVEEVVADARVRADAAPHHLDVGAELLGQVGQLVHEADPGGEHRVGGVLGELGAAHVGDDQALAVALEGRVERAHQQDGLVVVGAHDDAVGLHEVLDRRAFLQEFGVGDHAVGRGRASLAQLVGDRLADPVGGADGHGALVDHHLVVGHAAADVAGGGQHVLHVGRAVLVGGRAHGDELHGAVLHRAVDVGGELQPAGGDVALHHGLQAGFVDGDAAAFQDPDLFRVHVQAEHMVADFRQAGAAHEAHVPGSDHCYFHERCQVRWPRPPREPFSEPPAAGCGQHTGPRRPRKGRRRGPRTIITKRRDRELPFAARRYARKTPGKGPRSMHIETQIADILDTVLGLQGRGRDFGRDTPLLGALPELDSMAVLSLITALEEHFGLAFDDDELDGAAFATLGTLADLVRAKTGG
jgi:acyl carrier protein